MKESNSVTSAKTKQITPEVIEEAIKWLETETYCCHALACALSGYKYKSFHTEGKHIKQVSKFRVFVKVGCRAPAARRCASINIRKRVLLSTERRRRVIPSKIAKWCWS